MSWAVYPRPALSLLLEVAFETGGAPSGARMRFSCKSTPQRAVDWQHRKDDFDKISPQSIMNVLDKK